MKTSKIPQETTDSIKQLLLANNGDANRLGILLAQQHGWELCDIANLVVRNEIPNNGVHLLHVYFLGLDMSITWRINYSFIVYEIHMNGDWIDTNTYKGNKSEQYQFDKVVRKLIKYLVKALKDDKERIK